MDLTRDRSEMVQIYHAVKKVAALCRVHCEVGGEVGPEDLLRARAVSSPSLFPVHRPGT